MDISLIAAISENYVLGKDNQLLWRLPDDMKFFKNTTMGHPVVMGRKTFESFGKPLPGRKNIIVTRQKDYNPEGAIVVHNLDDAIAEAKKEEQEEIFIIGGGEIYKQTLSDATKIYLTLVHHTFEEGDAFFPEINEEEWLEVKRELHQPDERHQYAFTFLFLERKH